MASNENTRKLVVSILDFLDRAVQNNVIFGDEAEGIEVAKQCIAEGFGLDASGDLSAYKVPNTLEDIFEKYSHSSADKASSGEFGSKHEEEDRAAKAEAKKKLGNEQLIKGNFQEAINLYTEAINLVDTNAIYYGNRAAAYSQLGDHGSAAADAQKAVELDPSYAKGYSRLGHAHYGLENYQAAIDAYSKGLELEPTNVNLQSSLNAAKTKLTESTSSVNTRETPTPGNATSSPLGGMDFASMLNNPAIMNMARNMMNSGGIDTLMKNPAIAKMAENVKKTGKFPDMSDLMSNPEIANLASNIASQPGATSGGNDSSGASSRSGDGGRSDKSADPLASLLNNPELAKMAQQFMGNNKDQKKQ
ncbi:Small glutamine-rich tetratricopeptide repeat-containing protein 2 [Spiromyces aspiralis]|uniref:Small glutamine-rich tetratricopeptide repeat-containing protein 2 n=1 Tax=Spiromyces aspiralis TaxID=68401 RepID=A0ACC1HFB7_9FUNG|nr:Small glutamine-rich tetratricopeptide repeat-containing protein 2 [Spiromyces aspiralis]